MKTQQEIMDYIRTPESREISRKRREIAEAKEAERLAARKLVDSDDEPLKLHDTYWAARAKVDELESK